jgi:hypothetical protein
MAEYYAGMADNVNASCYAKLITKVKEGKI